MAEEMGLPSEEEPFITLVSGEDLTGELLEESLHHVLKIMQETGVQAVLIDASRLHNPASHLDIFQMFQALRTQLGGRHLRVAVLKPATDRAVDNARFAESVALNRGIASRIFDTRAEAVSWLTAPPSSKSARAN